MNDRVDLGGELRARLGPSLAVLAFLFAISAPLAYFAMDVRELRARGTVVAAQAADTLARYAEEQPVLWRYDSLKLVEHLRAFQSQPDIARIDVVDARGAPIDPGFERPGEPLLWSSAPIEIGGRTLGTVWVGASPSGPRERSLLILAGFVLLSLLLSALVYAIAERSARRAEERIARLVERLAERGAEERLRALRLAALAEQEEDRRAIARDLHDSVGQSLTAIRIQTEVLSTRLAQGEEGRGEAERVARSIAGATDATIEEVRRALSRLRPAALDEIGLAAAIGRLCDDVEELAGVSVGRQVEVPGGLPTTVETALYRIVQEALTNVTRHAQGASVVEVSLHADGAEMVVEISDDGAGLDEARSGTGRGLRGMRERAELLGGHLEVVARTPRGTLLRARIPLTP
jgi:signal transduction histidine kinase